MANKTREDFSSNNAFIMYERIMGQAKIAGIKTDVPGFDHDECQKAAEIFAKVIPQRAQNLGMQVLRDYFKKNGNSIKAVDMASAVIKDLASTQKFTSQDLGAMKSAIGAAKDSSESSLTLSNSEVAVLQKTLSEFSSVEAKFPVTEISNTKPVELSFDVLMDIAKNAPKYVDDAGYKQPQEDYRILFLQTFIQYQDLTPGVIAAFDDAKKILSLIAPATSPQGEVALKKYFSELKASQKPELMALSIIHTMLREGPLSKKFSTEQINQLIQTAANSLSIDVNKKVPLMTVAPAAAPVVAEPVTPKQTTEVKESTKGVDHVPKVPERETSAYYGQASAAPQSSSPQMHVLNRTTHFSDRNSEEAIKNDIYNFCSQNQIDLGWKSKKGSDASSLGLQLNNIKGNKIALLLQDVNALGAVTKLASTDKDAAKFYFRKVLPKQMENKNTEIRSKLADNCFEVLKNQDATFLKDAFMSKGILGSKPDDGFKNLLVLAYLNPKIYALIHTNDVLMKMIPKENQKMFTEAFPKSPDLFKELTGKTKYQEQMEQLEKDGLIPFLKTVADSGQGLAKQEAQKLLVLYLLDNPQKRGLDLDKSLFDAVQKRDDDKVLNEYIAFRAAASDILDLTTSKPTEKNFQTFFDCCKKMENGSGEKLGVKTKVEEMNNQVMEKATELKITIKAHDSVKPDERSLLKK